MRKKCIKINRIKMHKYIYNFDGPFILWSKIQLLKKTIFDKKNPLLTKNPFLAKIHFWQKSTFDKKNILWTKQKNFFFDKKTILTKNPLLTKKSTFDEKNPFSTKKTPFLKKGLFVIGDFLTFKLISLTSNDLGNDSVLLKRTIIFKYGL